MDKSLKNTSKENKESREEREEIREEIKETGTLWLENDKHHHKIQMITIIGEIEGHEALSGNTKSTKSATIRGVCEKRTLWVSAN